MNRQIQIVIVTFIDHESHSNHLNFAVHETKSPRVVPALVKKDRLNPSLIAEGTVYLCGNVGVAVSVSVDVAGIDVVTALHTPNRLKAHPRRLVRKNVNQPGSK